MSWSSFSTSGVGTLHRIEGIMRKVNYNKIIEENFEIDARNHGLGRRWWFQT